MCDDGRRNHLAAVRRALFLDQAEVAKRAGVSVTTYRKAERAQGDTDPRSMQKIAGALGISPPHRVYLWGRDREAELRELLDDITAEHGASSGMGRWRAFTAGLPGDELALLLHVPADADARAAVETIWSNLPPTPGRMSRALVLAGVWAAVTANGTPFGTTLEAAQDALRTVAKGKG